MSRYKIQYLTLQGQTLTFTVSNYKIIEGDFIEFTDERTKKVKKFHCSRCEITEVEDGGY